MNRGIMNVEKPGMVRINPARILSFGFLLLIGIGTLLLMLPVSTNEGHQLSFIEALFEATSAVCVTGLVVVDTQTTFSLFGQIILLILIQIGGLGFMTIGIVIALFLGKDIGLKGRLMVQASLNQLSIEGVIKLVKFVVGFTFLLEIIGGIILSFHWYPEFGFSKSIFYGFFHSISAFNNAGFDVMGDFKSFTSYVGDFTVITTISVLIIIGGIGFTVVFDLIKKKSIKKLSLHTKLMIIVTILFNLIGAILFFLLESSNPGTLGSLTFSEKVSGSIFQSIVPRTAGFNSVDISELNLSSQIVTMFLMFIGGGSGGTAGGIKVTTFVVIILAIWTLIRGKDDVNLLERRIPKALIYRAFSIIVYSFMVIALMVFILSIYEEAPFNVIMFEVISAFGTVGLSLGLTPELTTVGKLVITIMMFIGRVGPLTLAFALAKGNKKHPYRYVEEKIMIG